MNEGISLREKLRGLDSAEGKKNYLDEVEQLVRKIETKGEEIGRGMTADVLVDPQCQNICLKVIKRKEVFRNGAHHERELMQYARERGIHVPQPYGSIEEVDTDYLFMERIHGIDIRTIVEQDRFKELPGQFDFKFFFEQLRVQVQKMHDARLYHRDLHEGNIMVSFSDGSPVIIDLGSSLIQRVGGEDPYRVISAKGDLGVHPDDKNKIMEAYRFLGDYLKNNGYFQRK